MKLKQQRIPAIPTEFSSFLDNAIIAKGLKNKVFAKKVHHDETSVSRWRRGLLFPPMASLSAIANVLGVELEELTRLWRAQKYPGREFPVQEKPVPKKIKARLLLHFFEGEKFIGQTFPEMTLDDMADLEKVVIGIYPGTKYNLHGIPTGTPSSPVLLQLPSLKEGYSPNTTVRVIQMVLL